MTYQQLGELFGVTKGQAWRLAHGERTVAAEDIARVSSLTGIPGRDIRPDLAAAFETSTLDAAMPAEDAA